MQAHYRTKYFNLLNNNNTIIKDFSIKESSNIEFSSINTNTLNFYFKSSNIKKKPSFILFSKEEYKNYLLAFIINNNLPFSIVKSFSFNNLIKYLKDNISIIERNTIRKELNTFYKLEINKLKSLLNRTTS